MNRVSRLSEEYYDQIKKAKVGDLIVVTDVAEEKIEPTLVEIIEINDHLDFKIYPKIRSSSGTYFDYVFNSMNILETGYRDTWYFYEGFSRKKVEDIIKNKIGAKGTYKGVLHNLKDALSIAMTTQEENDKEIYKRIYDYITERMREVDESRKENE